MSRRAKSTGFRVEVSGSLDGRTPVRRTLAVAYVCLSIE